MSAPRSGWPAPASAVSAPDEPPRRDPAGGRRAAEPLPFLDRSFDAVLSMGVLEYTADDVRALVEMARVLRPGGVLIFTLGRRRPAYDLWRRFVYYPLVDLARPLYVR